MPRNRSYTSPFSRSYTSQLLTSPEYFRAQVQIAWDAYDAQTSDCGFPQWDVVVSAASLRQSLPPPTSNFLIGNEEEDVGALRAAGCIRQPRESDGEFGEYAIVVELGFRGTQDTGHWATNLSVELEALEIGPSPARVHRGFQRGYMAMRDGIHSAIDEQLSGWNGDLGDNSEILMLLSGHSLGGALAVLAAYDFACCSKRRYNVRCVTWGCPRVGDAEFAGLCAAAVPVMARFINKLDPVPCLPPNLEDPNGDDSIAMQSFLRSKFGCILDLPKMAMGAVGFCHVCPGFLLDPETSSRAHLLVSGLEAIMENAGDATKSLFAPHMLQGYVDNGELALKRMVTFSWSRLPSVGTWLQCREQLGENPFGPLAAHDFSQGQLQEMVKYGIALLQDSEGQVSSSFLEFCQELRPVLEQGPELLESDEGAKVLREVQDKMLCVLPLLTATVQQFKLSGKVLKQLNQSSFGQRLLETGHEQWLEANKKPDMLKDWVRSLDTTRTPGISFTEHCANIVDKLKHQYLDFLSDEATKEQLLAVGVTFDENGHIKLQEILEKREELLNTPLGERILKRAQKRALSLISGLEAVASGTTLSQHSQLLLSQLEETDQGREMLVWGREQVIAAKQDPAYLRSLFASADKDYVNSLGEWCNTVLAGDPEGWSSAKDQCLDFLRSPAAKQVLQKVGVDVDEHGNVDFAQVIEKSQQLLETPEGAQILKAVQNQILDAIPTLESTMDEAGLMNTSKVCIEKLEMTEEGRKLLDWGRTTLEEAQRDPDALKKWIGSADTSVITDASSRDGFIQALTDQFLDFLLAQLPSVEIPTLRKEKDGKIFTLSNITLGSCSIKKEHVHIKLIGNNLNNPWTSEGTTSNPLVASEHVSEVGGDSRAELDVDNAPHMHDTLEQEENDNPVEARNPEVHRVSVASSNELLVELTNSEKEDFAAAVFGGDLGRKQALQSISDVPGSTEHKEATTDVHLATENIEPIPQIAPSVSSGSASRDPSAAPSEQKNAAVPGVLEEIVRLTAREITLDIPDVNWTFQQETFPYWKDEGVAVARGRGACIILTFGLQRTVQEGKVTPCFALSSHSVVLNDFQLEFKQTKLSWLYNTLVRWFQQAVQEYVVWSLEDAITNNMEMLLTPLNGRMQTFWPLVLMTAGISVDMLPEADANHEGDPAAVRKLGILVHMKNAVGLKNLNRTGDNPWCWCSILDRNGRFGAKRECASKVVKNTLSPDWSESHFLAPWRRGEGLQFIVYDQGSIGSKVQGSANLPSNWFYPTGFDGSLELSGLGPDAKLFVQVTAIVFEEHSITLQQQVGEQIGLTVDPCTLEVLSVIAGGVLGRSCQEQGTCIQSGDYVCGFAVREGSVVQVTSTNVKSLLNALESMAIKQLFWRRAVIPQASDTCSLSTN